MRKTHRISWKNFEETSSNYQVDFEKLCRLFFKEYFLNDLSINLPKTTNNPGIETEPAEFEGKKLGFQAKYFSNNVDYFDIFDSAKNTVKYYTEKIDKVVLFCNKDININAKKFVETIELLNNNAIEFESFCNDSLLDVIDNVFGYERIKALYFSALALPNEWFSNQLKKELLSLSPRYVKGFHVTDSDIERYFDIIYRTDNFFREVASSILEWKKECRLLKIQDSIKKQIEKELNCLEMSKEENILDIFDWYKRFENEKKQLESVVNSMELELADAYRNKKDEQFIRDIREKLHKYNKALGLIEKTNLRNDEYLQYLDKKIFILEGDAGIGKSHLLGYEAEIHNNPNKVRNVLILGQKLIFDIEPENQLLNYLGLKDTTFDEFLDACEAIGETNNSLTVIIIDAINECSHYAAWKNYFSDLINKIQNKSYIRLIVSIRSTYKEYLFSKQVCDLITNGQIGVIRHKGFESILAEAIPAFFHEYNIPITTSAYLEEEFKNPLFLMTYCKGYNKRADFGGDSIYKWYLSFIKNEEVKIKEQKEMVSKYPYAETILNRIGQYFFEHNLRKIPYEKLIDLTKDIDMASTFIDGFIHAKAFVGYMDLCGVEQIYLNYEKFADFVIARVLLDKSKDVNSLITVVKETLLATDQYGSLKNYTSVGVFAALSILVKEEYGCELIDCLQCIPEQDLHNRYLETSWLKSICMFINTEKMLISMLLLILNKLRHMF